MPVVLSLEVLTVFDQGHRYGLGSDLSAIDHPELVRALEILFGLLPYLRANVSSMAQCGKLSGPAKRYRVTIEVHGADYKNVQVWLGAGWEDVELSLRLVDTMTAVGRLCPEDGL